MGRGVHTPGLGRCYAQFSDLYYFLFFVCSFCFSYDYFSGGGAGALFAICSARRSKVEAQLAGHLATLRRLADPDAAAAEAPGGGEPEGASGGQAPPQAEGGAAGAAGLLWNALVGGLMLFFLCSTIQEVARQR